VQINKV